MRLSVDGSFATVVNLSKITKMARTLAIFFGSVTNASREQNDQNHVDTG